MSQLDAILFDIDDTLFSTTAFTTTARARAVESMVSCGLTSREPGIVTPAAIKEAALRELTEVISEFGSNYDHHFDKLVIRMMGRKGMVDRRAMIVAAGVIAYHDTKFKDLAPFPDVRPLLSALVASGTRIGIITHGWTTKQAEKLIRLKLLPEYFAPDHVFISDAVGINKPNKKLYQGGPQRPRPDRSEPRDVRGRQPAQRHRPAQGTGHENHRSRRASRTEQSEIQADHEVWNFLELAQILRDQYGIPIAILAE
ncbi:MAG: HAD hydrolase-like protein [Planctomycetota bacterium]